MLSLSTTGRVVASRPLSTSAQLFVALVAAFAFALFALPTTAGAVQSDLPLSGGSNFQAADGDQINEDGYDDWELYALTGATKLDAPVETGSGTEDYFYKGNEHRPNEWTVDSASGGITPGKSNALAAASLRDPLLDTTYFYFSFVRELDASSSAFYGFEMNKLTTMWTNDAGTSIPCRSDGDLMISYNIDASAKNVEIVVYRWAHDPAATDANDNPACPEGGEGEFTLVSPGPNSQAHMNFEQEITNFLRTDKLGATLSAGRFGEGAVNLTAIFDDLGSNPCFNFGQVQLHSRSSAALDSALQDTVDPMPLDVRNCSVEGTKWRDDDADGVRDAEEPGLGGWTFFVDYDGNGELDAGEPSGVSESDGTYTIADVNPMGAGFGTGPFAIHEIAPDGETGWACSYPATADDHGCAYFESFTSSGNKADRDFGNVPPGDIVIRKVNVGGTQSDAFAFASTGLGGGFSLAADSVTGEVFANVEAKADGTYTVTEADLGQPTGYRLTGLSCDDADSTTSLLTRTATVNVSPGETVTCTFTNTKDGQIVVEKQTDPDGDQASFAFTTTAEGLAELSLSDGGSGSIGVPPGTYTATEAAAIGWNLTGLACDDGDSTGNTATRTATFNVAAGEIVKCTFSNTKIVPGIQVVKDGDTFAYHGDTVSYTFDVTNTGNGPLHDVAVSDDKCPQANVTGPVKTGGDDDALLETGETWTYSCSYTIGAHADGEDDPITNTVTASGMDEFDRPVSDTDTHETDLLHVDIDLDKTGPLTAQAGDPVPYTITITNTGDTSFAQADITLSDPKCAAAPVRTSVNGDGSDSSLDPGDTWTYTCSVNTTIDDDEVVNTASVVALDENEREASDSDPATTTLLHPQIGVDKAALSVVVNAGEDASFTITTSNAAGENVGIAKGVTLNDPLPAGVLWELVSQTNPDECAITGAKDSQVLACAYGDLAPGASRSVTIKAATSYEACKAQSDGDFDNTATADATNAPAVQDSAAVTCQTADVSITKTTSTPQITGGEVAKFQVKVENKGPGIAKDVVIEDLLPAGVTWSADGALAAGCALAEVEVEGSARQKVTCSFAAFGVGSVTFNLVAPTTVTVCDTYPNTSSVTGSNFPGSESSATVVCTKPDPAIAIDKVGPATALAGSRVTYALGITNTGPTSYLEGLVILTDAQCEAPPALSTKNGDATPATFDPGETWVYTCTVQTALGQTRVDNLGRVDGTDVNGKKASAQDTAVTLLSQPVQEQLPEVEVTPGSAKLTGPTGCLLKKSAYASVTGKQIEYVRFKLGNKTLKVVRKADSKGRYRVLVRRTSTMKAGSYRIQAVVKYKAASKTKARTLSLRFSVCNSVKPSRARGFTG